MAQNHFIRQYLWTLYLLGRVIATIDRHGTIGFRRLK
jgi:hypothetical protein